MGCAISTAPAGSGEAEREREDTTGNAHHIGRHPLSPLAARTLCRPRHNSQSLHKGGAAFGDEVSLGQIRGLARRQSGLRYLCRVRCASLHHQISYSREIIPEYLDVLATNNVTMDCTQRTRRVAGIGLSICRSIETRSGMSSVRKWVRLSPCNVHDRKAANRL